MGFKSIKTFQYRNLKDQTIDLSGREVFFVGENGQGKTNLLEALYVLSFGGSFRQRKEQEIIRRGGTQAAVFGYWSDEDDPLGRKISVALEKRRKRIKVNDKLISDRKELIGQIPCVVFSHDDLEFVQGSPERRRFFFDQTLSFLDPGYVDTLRRYKQVLKHRNAVLKSRQRQMLPVYDGELVHFGKVIQEKRQILVEDFGFTFNRLFSSISGLKETLKIQYRPTWTETLSPEELLVRLEENSEQEMKMGTTKSGPHRDLLVFNHEGREFSHFGSMGQKRLVALLLRVAQARYVYEKTGKKPILLLDDVLLELDPVRRERFLAELPEYEQAFFTFLPGEPYERYRKSNTLVLKVSSGEVGL